MPDGDEPSGGELRENLMSCRRQRRTAAARISYGPTILSRQSRELDVSCVDPVAKLVAQPESPHPFLLADVPQAAPGPRVRPGRRGSDDDLERNSQLVSALHEVVERVLIPMDPWYREPLVEESGSRGPHFTATAVPSAQQDRWPVGQAQYCSTCSHTVAASAVAVVRSSGTDERVLPAGRSMRWRTGSSPMA